MKNKLDLTTAIHVSGDNSSVRPEMICYFAKTQIRRTSKNDGPKM
jgi:hypothetical protein